MVRQLFIYILLVVSFACYAQHRQEIHSKHFLYGYPFGTQETNDLIIRDIYALSNNDDTKFADWVAYRLDQSMINGPTRSRNWKADPWLDENETLEPADYDGAPDALSIDRGHQAPLGSFDGTETWYETNYLSNITPQKSALNQGVWKTLEDRIRDLVDSLGAIYVMTGPLYTREMPLMPNSESHKVPSGYWKIIYFEKGRAFHVAAFIFDQETPRGVQLKDYLVSVDEVEAQSGLDFFWMMDDSRETSFETSINIDWAKSLIR